MPKKDDGVATITGVLKSVRSQTTQYKPFDYEMDFGGLRFDGDKGIVTVPPVVVKFEIPAIDIVYQNDNVVIVDMDGFRAVLVRFAQELDKVEAEYKRSV